jgi:hypothetical protein
MTARMSGFAGRDMISDRNFGYFKTNWSFQFAVDATGNENGLPEFYFPGNLPKKQSFATG